MSTMKKFLAKPRPTVSVPFLGDTVEVQKLSVAQVRTFQKELESVKETAEEGESGIAVQRTIIRLGVVGAAELTDEELDSFPLDDLSELAKAVLEQAGVRSAEGNA